MIGADGSLQDPAELGGTEGPAFLHNEVVDVLDAKAEQPAEEIQRFEQFLEVDEMRVPDAWLPVEDRLQRCGGSPMSAPGVEVDEVDPRHRLQFFHSSACAWPRRMAGK